jgi:membrane-bound metal-dependent hydrolase YbcI (DUF457 family)
LLLSSVLRSRQFQHSLSTAVAAVTAVGVAVVPMAAVVATMVVAVATMVVADLMAARGLPAEEGNTREAAFVAAVRTAGTAQRAA